MKIIDGRAEVSTDPEADQPIRDTMSQQRKQEIIAWLKQRQNAGLISKQEMHSRLKQIDDNIHLLEAADSAHRFTMSLGIMQVEDA